MPACIFREHDAVERPRLNCQNTNTINLWQTPRWKIDRLPISDEIINILKIWPYDQTIIILPYSKKTVTGAEHSEAEV